MTDGAPKWVLFCTYGCDITDPEMSAQVGASAWGLAIVDNEIDAVEAVANHIRTYNESHLPGIFMHPWIEMPTPGRSEYLFDQKALGSVRMADLVGAGYDFTRNLYVAPKEVPASWKKIATNA